MQSEERVTLMQEAATFSTPFTQTASGLEAWFTLPDLPGAAPPKWKLFLTTIPSAYLASLLVILMLNAFLHGWSILVTNGIVTIFLAFMLTYIGLPLSTQLLHSWLYPQEK
jgi:antibiotic biosynthesis monooxygenase (ABM) superfamily enzyme